MKISVSTYSFSQLLTKNEMTQIDCVKKAKEIGFDGIEICELSPPEGCTKLQYAQMIKEEAQNVGIEIANFCCGANFLNEDLEGEIAKVKSLVDCAAVLGVKNMRHDIGWCLGKDFVPFFQALPKFVDAIREIADYAGAKGIKTCSENHGYYCQDSDRMEKIVDAVNHPNYGLLLDMGNFLCVDENPTTAFSRLAPYAIFSHAKDFVYKSSLLPNPGEMFFPTRAGNYLKGTIIGHGDVPVLACIKALKRAEYDGYISVEFEGHEDALEGIKIGYENLKRYIGMA